MSIVEINSNYSIDILNYSYNTFIGIQGSNITITLPDASSFDVTGLYFFNKTSYTLTIQPYSGSSIIGGNITLGQNNFANLYSFNNEWFRF
jgi:hypothetical protein